MHAFVSYWQYHRIMNTAAAQVFSNIAFIKYWGNRDNTLLGMGL
jgi:mevalonate pyrophosphate decarboxylase